MPLASTGTNQLEPVFRAAFRSVRFGLPIKTVYLRYR